MFSFWALVHLWTIPFTFNLAYLFHYSFLPLSFALFVKGLERNGKRFLFYSALSSLLFSPSEPVGLVLLLLLVTLYTTYCVAVERRGRTFIKRLVLFGCICIIMNAFWLLPLAALSQSIVSSSYRTYAPDLVVFGEESLPVVDTVRMAGYWTLKSDFFVDPIVPWAVSYTGVTLFIVVSFVAPILSFMAVLVRRERQIVFFTLLAVLSIFLMKGSQPPGGWILDELLRETGGIVFSRNPSQKFGPLLAMAYSFLSASAIVGIGKVIAGRKATREGLKETKCRLKKTKCRRRLASVLFAFLLVFLLLGVSVWPYWTGDVIRPAGKVIPSGRVRVPSYYLDAADWLNKQRDDFFVLSLPVQDLSLLAAYWWTNGTDGYFGQEPGFYLFDKPIVNNVNDGNGLVGELIALLQSGSSSEFAKTLALVNIKFILLHEDYQPTIAGYYDKPTDPSSLRVLLEHARGLTWEKTFGKLLFYRNSLWVPGTHIYGATRVSVVNGSTVDVFKTIASSEFSIGGSVVFLESQLSRAQLELVEGQFGHDSSWVTPKYPTIVYRQMDPTQYRITVNATDPFVLVMSESYHEGWKAYYGDTDWFESTWKTQVDDVMHLFANGYANAWLIDPSKAQKDRDGTFVVTLQFLPQRYSYIGDLLSSAAFLVSIFYLGLVAGRQSEMNRFKKRDHEH
jgi:hypothetical protein